MLKLSIIILSSIYVTVNAQDVPFPVNDIGKYEFAEVVELHGIDKEKLFSEWPEVHEKSKSFKFKKEVLCRRKRKL